jgi:hypothetical protein
VSYRPIDRIRSTYPQPSCAKRPGKLLIFPFHIISFRCLPEPTRWSGSPATSEIWLRPSQRSQRAAFTGIVGKQFDLQVLVDVAVRACQPPSSLDQPHRYPSISSPGYRLLQASAYVGQGWGEPTLPDSAPDRPARQCWLEDFTGFDADLARRLGVFPRAGAAGGVSVEKRATIQGLHRGWPRWAWSTLLLTPKAGHNRATSFEDTV